MDVINVCFVEETAIALASVVQTLLQPMLGGMRAIPLAVYRRKNRHICARPGLRPPLLERLRGSSPPPSRHRRACGRGHTISSNKSATARGAVTIASCPVAISSTGQPRSFALRCAILAGT